MPAGVALFNRHSHSNSHYVTIEARKPACFRGQEFGRRLIAREKATFSPPSHGGNTGSNPVCATSYQLTF
jgi:hypothetical protein